MAATFNIYLLAVGDGQKEAVINLRISPLIQSLDLGEFPAFYIGNNLRPQFLYFLH